MLWKTGFVREDGLLGFGEREKGELRSFNAKEREAAAPVDGEGGS